MTARARAACLLLSLLQARTGTSLVSRLGGLSPEEVLDISAAELARRARMTERTREAFDELRAGFDPDDILDRLARSGADAITLADEEYPEPLREIPDPPPTLFVRGAIPEGPYVALVGSRKASVNGRGVAREIGRELAERDVCVVSGLALGIDAASHEGAVSVNGPAVGVLGCGIDVVYPKKNRTLFDKVTDSGCIVSEYFLGEAPLAWRFPARNRIIAGMCNHLVVIEAAEKSGALITAHHALEAGREVWAVPGPVGAPECRGSNKLLADGAGVLWDISEFVDTVAPPEAAKPEVSAVCDIPLSGLPDNEARVLSEVGYEPMEVDLLSQRCGVEVPGLLSTLTLLELKGFVSRNENGAFVRRYAR